jgi:hypothetical protein
MPIGNVSAPLKSRTLLAIAILAALTASGARASKGGGLLKIGDSVRAYLNQHPIKYSAKIQGTVNWREAGMLEYGMYIKGVDDTHPAILLWDKQIPIGVLQGKPPSSYFLFDTDGDGVLDYRSNELILPTYIVLSNSPIVDPSRNELKKLLDAHYEAFQSDAGPYENKEFRNALASAFNPYAADNLKPNRDLFYLLSYYLGHAKEPKLALAAISELQSRFTRRYKEGHPVILLFLLESSINANDEEAASRYCGELLKLHPDFVPAVYYQCRLEKDPQKAAELANRLGMAHPDHWLVKILIRERGKA